MRQSKFNHTILQKRYREDEVVTLTDGTIVKNEAETGSYVVKRSKRQEPHNSDSHDLAKGQNQDEAKLSKAEGKPEIIANSQPPFVVQRSGQR